MGLFKQSLSVWAAQQMSLHNPEEAELVVEASIVKLRRYANIAIWGLCFLGATFVFLSIVSAGECFYFVFERSHSPDCLPYLIVFLLSFFCVLLSPKLAAWFQVRRTFFVRMPYDVALPIELDRLMAQLRKGELRAYTSVGYGKAPVMALQTSEGVLLDDRISPETFTNRYAPLLLSSKKKTWALFWLSFRRAIIRPIYIEIPAEDAENTDTLDLAASEATEEGQMQLQPESTKDTVPTVAAANEADENTFATASVAQKLLLLPPPEALPPFSVRERFIMSKLSRVPADGFDELFTFINQVKGTRSVKRTVRWEGEKKKKWEIVIRAAHIFSIQSTLGTHSEEKLFSACLMALKDAKKADEISYIGLNGETDSEDWVHGFIYNEKAYGWIHDAVGEFNSLRGL